MEGDTGGGSQVEESWREIQVEESWREIQVEVVRWRRDGKLVHLCCSIFKMSYFTASLS